MVEVCVCIGTSCHLKGSYNVMQTFQQIIEEKSLHDEILLKSTFCMKACAQKGVAVSVNGCTCNVAAEAAGEFFEVKVMPLVRGNT
jgi:NADH:ubiquinone oxidoreductase subunit E